MGLVWPLAIIHCPSCTPKGNVETHEITIPKSAIYLPVPFFTHRIDHHGSNVGGIWLPDVAEGY